MTFFSSWLVVYFTVALLCCIIVVGYRNKNEIGKILAVATEIMHEYNDQYNHHDDDDEHNSDNYDDNGNNNKDMAKKD